MKEEFIEVNRLFDYHLDKIIMSNSNDDYDDNLKEIRENLFIIINAVPDIIVLKDGEGRWLLANDYAIKLFRLENVNYFGKKDSEIHNIFFKKVFSVCLDTDRITWEKGRTSRFEEVIPQPDGEDKIFDVIKVPLFNKDGSRNRIIVYGRDITDIKKLMKEIEKVNRLESIGTLAGGIAHDFNNLLTGIIGHISLLKLLVKHQNIFYKNLIEAEKASFRARNLTQQLLTFSKGGAPIKRPLLINNIIKDAANFAISGSKLKCEFSIPDDLLPVEADRGQLSQVIHNLVINATQAYPRDNTIYVSAENIALQDNEVWQLKQGNYVKISVKDRGVGIPRDNLEKVFDPYFTTKDTGNGLGLSICFSIIKNHGGYIDVESQPGKGTIFYFYLPATSKEVIIPGQEAEIPIHGYGRILLMDDEESVRVVSGKLLNSLGYEVEFAENGEEAIKLYKNAKNSNQPFDAVILDLTIIGGMGGRKTIEKLREFDPEIKAIVSSGYSNDPIMADFNKFGFKGVLAKPYNLQELSQALYDVLNN